MGDSGNQPHKPSAARGSEPKLSFKPLSDGLGFHPFSDGLPYAPISKAAPVAPPSGAISAGPAIYAPSKNQSPKPTPKIPAPMVSIPRPVSVPVVATAPVRAPAPVDLPPEAPALDLPEENFGILYLIKRVLGYTIDTTLNLALCIATLAVALWRQDLNPDSLLSPGVLLPFVFFLAAFNWAIITAQEIAFGTSLGKRIFGLGLRGSASAIFLRAFFFLPSLGFCGAGIAWALFDRHRRCWHDIVVDLQPTGVPRF